MNCLAVDPGKRAGWAVRFEDRIARSGVVCGDDVIYIQKMIKTYRSLKTLVIEDQYFPRGRNPKGLKTLFYRRHIWEVLARADEMDVVPIHPATWQSFFKLRPGDKDAAREIAGTLVGREVDYDESDAILICECHALKQGVYRC